MDIDLHSQYYHIGHRNLLYLLPVTEREITVAKNQISGFTNLPRDLSTIILLYIVEI